ncbi:MAG: MBL fold metallo-hydrolase [Gemmatimonadaceae bacterium]
MYRPLLVSSLAVALVWPPSATAMNRVGPFDYDRVEVAPGVTAYIEQRFNPVVSGNITVVRGSTGAVIFDAGQYPSITRRIAEGLRREHVPVKYVVVSHWHDDHFMGLAQIAEVFPRVQIIAHPETARLMETRRATMSGEPCSKQLIEQSQGMRDALRAGKRPDGTPLPATSRERLARFVEAMDSAAVECNAKVYRPVDRMISDSLVLDLGDRSVVVRHLGRGNTAGDLVLWVPDAQAIMTGDLVVYPFPFCTQPYITEWTAALRKVEAFEPQTLIPGHGPVMHDLGYVRTLAELSESIASQARAAYQPGISTDSLAAHIDLTKFTERITHGDAFLRVNFDDQMHSAIERMRQELSGTWKPEGVEGT